jgi:hypothetical protein
MNIPPPADIDGKPVQAIFTHPQQLLVDSPAK